MHDGTGPPILLVHGMLSSRAQWDPNLEALSKVGRPVVVELLGHGRSPSPDRPECYSPSHYCAQFEKIRARLGAERWIVLGQSLGAALTLRYALDYPERVVAHAFTNSNSALADSDWRRQVRFGMRLLLERLEREGPQALEAMPVHPRHSRLPGDAKAALVADAQLHTPRGVGLTALHTVADSSVRARIHENRRPCLLLVGERERRFASHRAFAEAKMPMLDAVGLDAGHAVNIEVAARFNEEVVAFLREAARTA